MKIQYAISINDFRAVQTPFTGRARANTGFKGAMVACSLITVLGVYCLVHGWGSLVGGFLIGLGALAAIARYFYHARSVRLAKQKYETNLLVAYQRLHCRDDRTVEWDENGFTLICKCGMVTHPWSELAQFSESGQFFQLRTERDGTLLPKLAFTSEGDRTGFRRLATEQINNSRDFASRPLEFVSTPGEYTSAQLLHTLQGGGWRPLARAFAYLVVLGCIMGLLLKSPPANPAEAFALVSLAMSFGVTIISLGILIRPMTSKPYVRAPLRVYFGEEGLHVQDQITISRNPWEAFCGYLENRRVFLLYYNARFYRVIPKRALGSRESEFQELLQRKVSPFDYHYPFRLGPREVPRRV